MSWRSKLYMSLGKTTWWLMPSRVWGSKVSTGMRLILQCIMLVMCPCVGN